jgi:hypothetical protein
MHDKAGLVAISIANAKKRFSVWCSVQHDTVQAGQNRYTKRLFPLAGMFHGAQIDHIKS